MTEAVRGLILNGIDALMSDLGLAGKNCEGRAGQGNFDALSEDFSSVTETTWHSLSLRVRVSKILITLLFNNVISCNCI
jgi:hypothetical protein